MNQEEQKNPATEDGKEPDPKARKEAEKAAKEQAKLDAEEANKAREAEKIAKKEEAAKGKIVPADSPEHFSGAVTLTINQGAQGYKIMNLIQSLSSDSNIKVMSSGGATGKNSWISLSIQNSVPLFKIIYQIPAVQTVTRKGDAILLTLKEN